MSLFLINSVIRPQLLIVPIEPWPADSLALLSNLRLRLISINLTKVIILFQAVGKILRVKVITLLVRLVDGSIALVVRVRQLDEILLVDIGSVLGIFTLIKGRLLKIIINYRKCGAVAAVSSAIVVVADILIEEALL